MKKKSTPIALEDLKEQFPDIQFKIEQLKQVKINAIM